MSSFENLEDNFQKKAQEPIKTDQQKMHEHNQSLADRVFEDKPKYEESITNSTAVAGLAAMFQQRLEEVTKQGHEDGDSEGTVTFTTDEVVRYGDQVGLEENQVSDEDIQRFMPNAKYGETITAATDKNTIKDDEGRHDESSKYGDSFVVEHHTASIRDVSPKNRPIAERGLEGSSPDRTTDDEIAQHLADHRKNKTQKSETTIDDQDIDESEAVTEEASELGSTSPK
jgi:hypothetical protein